MKFVISSPNLKIFAKSILALFKVGDEVYIEPLQESLTLRTVNSSKSAFACFTFKESFFTFFQPELKKNLNKSKTKTSNNNNTLTNTNDEYEIKETEPFRCKIPSKCLLAIFKNVNSLEKNVEKCSIQVKQIPINAESASRAYDFDHTMTCKGLNENNEEQLYDIKFLVILSCKNNIRKSFILSISDCENLQTVFSIKKCSNRLDIGANETINCFSNDIDEVSFILEANKLSIKNYISQNADVNAAAVNTQVSFDIDEFQFYEIEKETDITFCLKEFKIGLQFGFYFDLLLSVYFQKKGRPIIFSYDNNSSFHAEFTLATLSEDFLSQNSTIASSSANNNASMLNTSISRSIPNENELSSSRLTATKTPRGSKRSLTDTSNIYMDKTISNNNNNENVSSSNKKIHIENSDDDDALLSQALDEQEAKINATVNKNNNNKSKALSQEPPAKKMNSRLDNMFDDDIVIVEARQSLMKTLFDDQDGDNAPDKKKDEDYDDEEEEEEQNTVKRSRQISFATKTNNQTAVYIEETSSEEDD